MDDLRRVNDNSKVRCKASTAHSQCHFEAVEGSDYCIMHGGNSKKKAIYSSTNAVFLKMKNISAFHSLSEEIAIIRTLIETKLNVCQDENDLLMQSDAIANMVKNLRELIVASSSITLKMGDVLTAEQAHDMVANIITIISNHVTDTEVLENLSKDIAGVLLKTELNR